MFGTGSRFGPLALLALIVFMFVPLLACAEPGFETTIPAPAFVAAAGGDVAALPADCPPIVSKAHWYDRQVAFDVHGQHADGRVFGMRYASSSDAGNALEARRSDNERAVSNFDTGTGLLQSLGLAYLQTKGIQLPQGAPVAPAMLDTKLEERFAALEQAIAKLSEQIASARAAPAPAPAAIPEVVLPSDSPSGGGG